MTTTGHEPTPTDMHTAHLALHEPPDGNTIGLLYGLTAALLDELTHAHPACGDPDCGICPRLRLWTAIHHIIQEKAQ